MLMLGCEEAVLQSHQAAFSELLRVVRLQLLATLGGPQAVGKGGPSGGGPSAGASGVSGDDDDGNCEVETPFGISMVEEMLPDSFLRKTFGSFFGMLQV